jgi:glycosyltransferase involved in cell wall biosynthesis
MKKLNVLVPVYDLNASEYFRSALPGMYMKAKFGNEVHVEMAQDIIVWDIHTLRNFDVIHFHRYFGHYDGAKELFSTLQENGVKLIMDLDDHWETPEGYFFHKELTESGLNGRGVELIPLVDMVTTTTELFADLIREHNENVFVLPNGLNHKDPQWEIKESNDSVVRIGWLGSKKRHHDLAIIKDAIDRIYADEELKGKFRFVLCGGEKEEAKIFQGEGFKHINGLPASKYGILYDEVDVCLAPIEESLFNTCRSELKISEAGMKKKAFIGQDFGIYPKRITHNVNGLLAKTSDDWYDYMKRLILNPSEIERLGNSLHGYVMERFTMENVTRQRIDLYKTLVDEKLV